MPPRIDCVVSESVWRAVEARRLRNQEILGETVDALLSEALELERHSLFQVSTSNALVEGVFGGITTVGDLLQHGDFGLGTFASLDGEMIIVDGECFRATVKGVVSMVDNDREVPFAVMTRFVADLSDEVESEVDLPALTGRIDGLRPSQNLFVGIRVDGLFDELTMRAICRARPGEGLVEATGHQSEFGISGVRGTLVGFWSPEYSKSVSVPGYHLHFISDDRNLGGHVLGLRGSGLTVRLHTESDLHLALPETVEFLTADLAGDHQPELDKAESERDGR
jgi:acetolactate decarboxylase